MLTISSTEKFETVTRGGVVLVLFTSPWCATCRFQELNIQNLEERFAGTLEIARIDIDQHEDLAQRLGIHGLPTFGLFHHGKEVLRLIGVQQTSTLQTLIETVFSGYFKQLGCKPETT